MEKKEIIISNLEDLKFLIVAKYGSRSKFCEVSGIRYPVLMNALDGKTKLKKHIEKICVILEIDYKNIEEWKDV